MQSSSPCCFGSDQLPEKDRQGRMIAGRMVNCLNSAPLGLKLSPDPHPPMPTRQTVLARQADVKKMRTLKCRGPALI